MPRLHPTRPPFDPRVWGFHTKLYWLDAEYALREGFLCDRIGVCTVGPGRFHAYAVRSGGPDNAASQPTRLLSAGVDAEATLEMALTHHDWQQPLVYDQPQPFRLHVPLW